MTNIEEVAALLVASALAAMQPDIAHPVIVIFIRDPNDEDEVLMTSSCLTKSTISLIIDALKTVTPNRCLIEESVHKSSETVVSELLKDVKLA